MEPLLDKVGHFGQLNIDLIKYKILDKMADLISSFIARFLLMLSISIFAIFLSIAAALWLGEILGKDYYGFLVVTGFYGMVCVFILYLQKAIKQKMNNWIITKMLN